MSTQISKIPLWSNWNGKYTPKITKIIKTPQKSQNVQKNPLNLLIDQSRLKISKTTKSTWKPLKWPKLPRKRLEWAVKSPKYPFGIIGMVNILQKTPKLSKHPKNRKMSKTNPTQNLLIDQNSLKISKTIKTTQKPLKWWKYPWNG